MTRSSAAIRTGKDAADSAWVASPASRQTAGELDALTRPVRIMHVLDRLDVGGTEKAVMKLVKGLEPGLFEHYICTLRGASAMAEEWAAGVTVLHAGRARAGFQFNIPRLVRVMRSVRPMIVHSRNWGGIEAVVAARLASVPVAIHSEHGYELEMQSGLPFRRRLLRHVVYRIAGSVATVTDDLRHYHAAQAWWAPESINVLYNGVDGEEFHPQPQVRDAVRRRLGIPPDALVVGSVGRMVPLKDLTTLLKAAEALVPETPNLHVILVGSGPELSRLQDYVGNSRQLAGRVVFPGTVDCVADLLNAMDIFVLPALMEGMSNTLLEALAVGLPVVATRVGGNPEVVADGVCGYLFPPGDVPELVSQLRTLLRDPQRRADFGRAARERALRHFSLEGMLRRYHDLYIGLAIRRGVTLASTTYVRN
jgi:sugar transferase (PEP-CTERM/EpsH1 system associated)